MLHEYKFKLLLRLVAFDDDALGSHGITGPRLQACQHVLRVSGGWTYLVVNGHGFVEKLPSQPDGSRRHSRPAALLNRFRSRHEILWDALTATIGFPLASSPTALSNACFNLSWGSTAVYPFSVFCIKAPNGREREWGMCPEESEGRGSGSWPVNLGGRGQYLS
jgi:hypothetical protein